MAHHRTVGIKMFIALILLAFRCANAHASGLRWDIQHLEPVIIHQTGAPGLHIYYLYREGRQGQVKPLTNGSILHEGDVYGIIFRPQATGYVYIFQVASTGKIKQLFPEASLQDLAPANVNPVVQGTTYYIPTEDRELRLGQQEQLKQIYVVASQGQQVALEDEYRRMLLSSLQHALKAELAEKKFLTHLRERAISDLTPVSESVLLAQPALTIPMVEQEIINALSMPLPESFDTAGFLTKYQSKGLQSGLDTSDRVFSALPKVTLLNAFHAQTAEIAAETYPLLDQYGKAFQRISDQTAFLIAAYSADGQDQSENWELARRRAEAIKNFLITHFQLDADRLLVQPYRDSGTIFSNETADGRSLNNRIEFIRIQ